MRYIKKNNKYIAANIHALFLYFDYFSPGVILNDKIDNRYTRWITHQILRALLGPLYLLGIYKLLYKTIHMESKALIVIEGDGKWKNRIELVERSGKLIIIKKTYDNELFKKEKRFYEKYFNKSKLIKLPMHKFKSENVIEYEFVSGKSFQTKIYYGDLSFNEAIRHFVNLKGGLVDMYKRDKSLIHGDFSPLNLILTKDEFYLIDYSDSFDYYFQFDLYVMLYSILFSFKRIRVNEKSISKFYNKENSIYDYLSVNKNLLKILESQFHSLRELKHPGMY